MCRTATFVVVVSIVLNFKLFIIFVSEKNAIEKSKRVTLTKGVFIWRRASPLCRDPASQFVFAYTRGGPAVLGGISLLTTEISHRRAGNFQYKRT